MIAKILKNIIVYSIFPLLIAYLVVKSFLLYLFLAALIIFGMCELGYAIIKVLYFGIILYPCHLIAKK